jgi:hypothetical protein
MIIFTRVSLKDFVMAIIQKKILTKFGYMVDMKVEKNRFIIYFWLPIGIYHRNQTIWKFLKFGEFGAFFHEKSFVLVKIIFFRLKFGENTLIRKTLLPTYVNYCSEPWGCSGHC